MGDHILKPITSKALLELLRVSAQHGFIMSRTRVTKLLYLADLEAVRKTGRQGTDLNWIWYHHGPYDKDLLVIERSLDQSGLITCATVDVVGSEGVYKEKRLAVAEDAKMGQDEIDTRFVEIIRATVEKYGSWSAKRIMNFTYETPPMVKIQKEGERGDALMLEVMVRQNDIQQERQEKRERLRSLQAKLPKRDRQQDLSWMEEEYAAARPSIERADALVS